MMNFVKQRLRLLLSAWITFVFIQSLFFKFAGSPETDHIFGTLGEWLGLQWFSLYGGYIIGSVELVASVLLFTRWWAWGALLAFEIISGAIVFHLFTPLGVVMPAFDAQGEIVGNDGGALFIMACLVWVSAAGLIVKDFTSGESQLRKFLPKNN